MRKMVALVFVFVLLLVMLTPAVIGVNSTAGNGATTWADGSAPVPPIPSHSIQWNDGSAPVPPIPS